jgi:uncharacterized protein YecE (DUF72 family)
LPPQNYQSRDRGFYFAHRFEVQETTLVVKKRANTSAGKAAESSPSSASNGIFAGTSGWSYPSWKPGFYPAEVSSKKFLSYYASQLNTVEVNYTFRGLPTEAMVQGWLAAVPSDFQFSFKAPQRITHMQRFRGSVETFLKLLAILQPITDAGQMGLLLFQLPPNFKADVPRLDDFLAEAATTGLRLAFEFRNNTWFSDDVLELLRKHQAALCVAESDELETPDEVTAPFSCYRLRKSAYSEVELATISKRLLERAKTGDVFAYFKHEDEPDGALRALALLGQLRQAAK